MGIKKEGYMICAPLFSVSACQAFESMSCSMLISSPFLFLNLY